MKDKLIEQMEWSMNDQVQFDLDQKEAMEIFYNEQDQAKKELERLTRLNNTLRNIYLGVAAAGAGSILISCVSDIWLK